MTDVQVKGKSGIGLIGLGLIVSIVFIVLHFAGVGAFAGMSWVWLLSPLWIGILASIAFFIVMLVVFFIVLLFMALLKS